MTDLTPAELQTSAYRFRKGRTMTGWQRIAEVGYPPEEGDYWTFYEPCRGKPYALQILFHYVDNGRHGFCDGGGSGAATHWMPIVYPEPPEKP